MPRLPHATVGQPDRPEDLGRVLFASARWPEPSDPRRVRNAQMAREAQASRRRLDTVFGELDALPSQHGVSRHE